jgi:flavin reductase (DIM6/NTAB) family NADH-FMN oxidoreductase RutF
MYVYTPVAADLFLCQRKQYIHLSFFDTKHREALNICGSESGRDIDKAGKAGLTPVVFDGSIAGGKVADAIGFKEVSDIIVCRKLYAQDFDPALFLDPVSIEKNYNGKDYHRMYIGEVLTLLRRS